MRRSSSATLRVAWSRRLGTVNGKGGACWTKVLERRRSIQTRRTLSLSSQTRFAPLFLSLFSSLRCSIRCLFSVLAPDCHAPRHRFSTSLKPSFRNTRPSKCALLPAFATFLPLSLLPFRPSRTRSRTAGHEWRVSGVPGGIVPRERTREGRRYVPFFLPRPFFCSH